MPALGGDVLEASVAGIAVQDIAIHPGDKEVGESVIVEIGHRGAHGIAGARDPRGLGDIVEFQIAVIVEEPVPVLGSRLLERGYRSTIGKKDIGPSIAIVVEDCDTAGHRFDQMLAIGGAVLEDKVETGGSSDLLKADRGEARQNPAKDESRGTQSKGGRFYSCVHPGSLVFGWRNLGFPFDLQLGFLASLQDLLVFCHGGPGLFRIADRLVSARQLIMQAAVFIQVQRFFQSRDGFRVLAQSSQRQAQGSIGGR